MKKTRLNQRARDVLGHLVRKIVVIPALNLYHEKAAVDDLVCALLEQRYPPADMTVLRRYDCARQDSCVRLNLTAGGVTGWKLSDPVPWRAGSYCSIVQADEKTTAAIGAYALRNEEHQALLRTKQAPYYALLQAARHFEDVVAIWPEAETVRAECGASSTALVPLSDKMIAAIQADVATRAQLPSTLDVDS